MVASWMTGPGAVEVENVLLDNKTGAVIGFVGGRDYASNQSNHAFDTERSPGSTIKPILAYGMKTARKRTTFCL